MNFLSYGEYKERKENEQSVREHVKASKIDILSEKCCLFMSLLPTANGSVNITSSAKVGDRWTWRRRA